MEAIVRPGTPDDALAVWKLFQAYQNWANVWHNMHEVVQFRVTEQAYAHVLRTYPSAVASVDGTIVGFAMTEAREIKVVELINFYVDDAFRKEGIGALLLEELEKQCHILGISTMFGFSSEKYYTGKRLPTGVFERSNWEVRRLGAATEMYLRVVPLTEEEQQRVWPTKGLAFPNADNSTVVTVDDLKHHVDHNDELTEDDSIELSGYSEQQTAS